MKAKYNKAIETSYEYTLKSQKEKYKEDDEFRAWSKFKYYKRKFKNHKEFQEILNSDKTNIEKLQEAFLYNDSYKQKIRKF